MSFYSHSFGEKTRRKKHKENTKFLRDLSRWAKARIERFNRLEPPTPRAR